MEAPTRMCLACRSRAPKPALVRLALVDGTVTADPLARRSGRGAYLCPRSGCLEVALARGGAKIGRALRLRGAVTVDETGITRAVAELNQDEDEENQPLEQRSGSGLRKEPLKQRSGSGLRKEPLKQRSGSGLRTDDAAAAAMTTAAP